MPCHGLFYKAKNSKHNFEDGPLKSTILKYDLVNYKKGGKEGPEKFQDLA